MSPIVSADALRVISEVVCAPIPTLRAAPVERPRPFWQTEPCPPWCDTTHRDEDYHEDRDHFVHGDPVDLNLYRTDLGNGEHGPGELVVGLMQHYREAEPEVDLTVPATTPKYGPYVATGEQGVRLTVAEARALRDRLTAMLDQVDGSTATLDVELVECGDNATRRSAEHTVHLGAPFWSGEAITSNLLQWHEGEQDSTDLEVEVMTAGNSFGGTPTQARTIARQLRAAAGNIERLAAVAEARNAQIGADL